MCEHGFLEGSGCHGGSVGIENLFTFTEVISTVRTIRCGVVNSVVPTPKYCEGWYKCTCTCMISNSRLLMEMVDG